MKPCRFLSKEDVLLEAAKGRDVLHLGCVGFTDLPTAERVRLAKESLHWKLSQVANVVGVDCSVQVIEEYKRIGLFMNIMPGNVERLGDLPLTQKFDVIIAGDIIEHLSNPGMMLDGIRRFCTPATKIIITTPHAFGLPNFTRFVVGKFVDGAEHVMTFSIDNIKNLLYRHGYSILRVDTCFQPRSAISHPALAFRLGKKILEKFPKFGGTLLIVASYSV